MRIQPNMAQKLDDPVALWVDVFRLRSLLALDFWLTDSCIRSVFISEYVK